VARGGPQGGRGVGGKGRLIFLYSGLGAYRATLGMRITKQNWRARIVFLSADPEGADHEIALFRGRPEGIDSPLINQISLRVATLEELRIFHRKLVAEGYRINAVVNRVSALGCSYFDPEDDRLEVFWATGRAWWVPIAHLIDFEQPDEAVLAEVDQLWERLHHVRMGERMANKPTILQLD
jgi:hypothetical protein